MDVSTVAADPYDLFAAFKDDALFEIFEQCIIALLVLFLNLADHLKERSYAVESLFAGYLGELFVHLGPLVVFACRRIAQIVYGRGYCAVVQAVEEAKKFIASGDSASEAAKKAAKLSGHKKGDIYKLLQGEKDNG